MVLVETIAFFIVLATHLDKLKTSAIITVRASVRAWIVREGVREGRGVLDWYFLLLHNEKI